MGKYVRKIVDDYCIIDLETTGLSIEFCDIIEIGILKVRKGSIVDKFQTLVKPHDPIDEFIEELTGITNDMLNDAPSFDSIKKIVTSFIGDDLIVGHNVSFDIGFKYREASPFNSMCSVVKYSQEARSVRTAPPSLCGSPFGRESGTTGCRSAA